MNPITWVVKFVAAVKLARKLIKSADEFIDEAKDVKEAYESATATASEAGKKISKKELAAIADESYDVIVKVLELFG